MRWLTIVALGLALTGCPYPIYKLIQPEASPLVVSDTGAPVEGANVALISNAYPYGFEKSRELKRTDVTGATHFDSHREWRLEVFLFIHGAEIYFWNWCVEKDGYETFRTQWANDGDFTARPTVVLKRGSSTSCERSER